MGKQSRIRKERKQARIIQVPARSPAVAPPLSIPPHLVKSFLEHIPAGKGEHMLHYFAECLARGYIGPFLQGLFEALNAIESVSPGYADEMLRRIGAIKGFGKKKEERLEKIFQVLSEIYVTSGAVQVGDRDATGVYFRAEPGASGGKKNPEFEVRHGGIWYAVEVKTPELLSYAQLRSQKGHQMLSRWASKEFLNSLDPTFPRDNPVKDFLISAEEKFSHYRLHRSDAVRILAIVWDDYIQEAVAALLSQSSGLLTDRSFWRDQNDQPVRYPNVDGVLLIRYQHQLMRLVAERPLADGERSFAYHRDGFPPKAFIQNPFGKLVPDAILEALSATPIEKCFGAEYMGGDAIVWVGGES